MTILFGIIFFFFPETPVYYLAKGNVTEARKSLIFFRGMNYDLEPELYELSEYLNEKKNVMSSSWNVFKSKQGMKSLGMSIGVMIFQQLSGVNAFIFNATNIFEVRKMSTKFFNSANLFKFCISSIKFKKKNYNFRMQAHPLTLGMKPS